MPDRREELPDLVSGLPLDEVGRRLKQFARLDRQSRSAVKFYQALLDGGLLDADTFDDLPEDAREVLEKMRAALAKKHGREISDEELPGLQHGQAAG